MTLRLWQLSFAANCPRFIVGQNIVIDGGQHASLF